MRDIAKECRELSSPTNNCEIKADRIMRECLSLAKLGRRYNKIYIGDYYSKTDHRKIIRILQEHGFYVEKCWFWDFNDIKVSW